MKNRTNVCVICDRPLDRRRIFAPAICTDTETCVILGQQRYGPPERCPIDPHEESRPHDLDTCSACRGHGAVIVSLDWETGAPNLEDCHRCAGSGIDPTRVPVTAH